MRLADPRSNEMPGSREAAAPKAAVLRRLEEIALVAAKIRVPEAGPAEQAASDLELACAKVRDETAHALELGFAARLAAREQDVRAEAANVIASIIESYKASIRRQDQILRSVLATACERLLDATTASRAIELIPADPDRQAPVRVTAGAGFAGTDLLQQLAGRQAARTVDVETTTALPPHQVMIDWAPGWAEIDGTSWLDGLKQHLGPEPARNAGPATIDDPTITQAEG